MALDAELAQTIAATREAGLIAMHYFENGHDAWEKGPGQIVTAADIEIDRLLATELPKIVSAAWLSEETEDDPARLNSKRQWIVDPIDGTRSFAAGKPEFTISVALAEAGQCILGVVLNPAKDEIFCALRNGGASLNDTPMLARPGRSMAGAEIVVSHTENRRRKFSEHFPQAHVTEIGSLAYKLARVAAGHYDAYFSWRKAHDWDIAAAALLLAEAGAEFSDACGHAIKLNQADPLHNGLVAGSARLHGELVAHSLARKEG